MEQCKFDIEDDFAVHAEMLAEFFVVKDIKTDEKKRSYLITSLSTRVYKLLRNLTDPKTPTEVEYKELLKLLRSQFMDKSVLFKERRLFYEAVQEMGEDIRQFYGKIKALSVNCDFGVDLEKILRDRFICGMQRGPTFDRLCEEKSDCSLERCVEIARNKEVAVDKNMTCNKIMRHKYKSTMEKEKEEMPRCNVCGRSNHDFKNCKYRGYRCRRCKSVGHLQVMCKERINIKTNYIEECQDEEANEELSLFANSQECRMQSALENAAKESNKQTQKTQSVMENNYIYQEVCDGKTNNELRVNMVAENGETGERKQKELDVRKCGSTSGDLAYKEKGSTVINQEHEVNIKNYQLPAYAERECKYAKCNNCNFFSYVSEFTTELEVEGSNVVFEIDTGSAVSIIPKNLYEQKFVRCAMKEFKSSLRAYNGAKIEVNGVITVKVGLNRRYETVQLVVITSNARPLVGRDVLRLFGFQFSFGLNLNKISQSGLATNLSEVLEQNKVVFENSLGLYKFEKIKLEVENVQPIFIKPRKVPYAYKELLEKEIDRLEAMGVVRKAQTVNWGTPLVTVIKKNKSLRVCADYSVTINKFLKDQNYPLPRIEEIFQALQGGEHFSKLDLSSAYHQLEVDEETSKLLAWSTHRGVYTVHRLPFGCKPNSAIFQAVMDKTLLGCKGTVAFIDDIVVTGKNKEEHIRNLKDVLHRLRDAGFKINKDKCEFFKEKISYLGYIIDGDGLHKDPKKLEAMLSMPTPSNITQIKSFCGLVNYYGKFVPNISSVLKPLYDATTKETFQWSQNCEAAMEQVKKILMSDVVLVHYDPKKPLILHTDASEYGIGACLSHRMRDGSERPIVYMSRTLSAHERNYSMIDKESVAIYWGVRKCQQYLLGREFEIRTDHKPLVGIFGSKKGIPTMAANRLQRWAIYLSNFSFKLSHIEGTKNNCADALSRLTCIKESLDDENETYLNFIQSNFSKPLNVDDIADQIEKDEMLAQVAKFVRKGWPKLNKSEGELRSMYDKRMELALENNILMWGHRVVIPKKFREQLLREVHSAHSGVVRCKEIIRSYFWWPNVDRDLEQFIKSCNVCRRCHPNPSKAQPKPWPTTSRPMERIHVDFCGPVDGYNFLIMIDVHTKWLEVYKMKTITSPCTIEVLRKIFSALGIPSTMVTDNGSSFTSAGFEKFCSNQGITHITSPAYHPASNGQAENAVRVFKKVYQKVSLDPASRNLSTDEKIAKILYFNRNSIHTGSKLSPYEAMFGRKANWRWELLRQPKRDQKVKTDQSVKKVREFGRNEMVNFRNFGSGEKWMRGVISRRRGNRVYEIKTSESKTYKRHIDHIIGHETQKNENSVVGLKGKYKGSEYESVVSAKIKLERSSERKPPLSTVSRGGEVGSRSSTSTEEGRENEMRSHEDMGQPDAVVNSRRKSERSIKRPAKLDL